MTFQEQIKELGYRLHPETRPDRVKQDKKFKKVIRHAYDITTVEGKKRYEKENAKRVAHQEMIAAKNREAKKVS